MIYFVRHALDDESFVGSWSNASILESEKEKTKELAQKIKELPITQIISSDITRARETAEIIAKELGMPVKLDSNLREQNKGTLTGKRRDLLTPEEKELIENQQIDTKFPNGETLVEVYERIKKHLEEIDKLEDGTLIVTHRGVINMIYYILTNTPLDMNKKRFDVGHLSVHEYDIEKKLIRRIQW